MRSLCSVLGLLLVVACSPVKAGDDDATPDAATGDAATRPDAMTCGGDDDCTGSASHCLDGLCVECLGPNDCGAGELCDNNTHECRGCLQHGECASMVCDPVLQTCAAAGDVVYADQANGSFDPNCGTKALPCNDLKASVDKLTEQRRYLSLFGNFSFFKPDFDKSVTIIGYGSARLDYTFVDASNPGPGIEVNAGANVVIDGLIVRNNADDDGIRCNAGQVHIFHSQLLGNSGNGVSTSTCKIEIADSDLSGNKQFGVSVYANELTLHSNLISGNVRGGIATCSDGLDMRNNLIINNSNENNYDGAIEVFCGEGQAPGVIAYNTIVGNGINGFERGLIACQGQASLQLDSNIIFGNRLPQGMAPESNTVTSCPGLGANVCDYKLNIATIQTADPQFVNRDNGDFHLKATSPARNQGVPAHALPFDFDGTSRSDGQPDMGCFEVP